MGVYTGSHKTSNKPKGGREGHCKAHVDLMSYVRCKLDKIAVKLFRLVGPQHVLPRWPTHICQGPQAPLISLFRR